LVSINYRMKLLLSLLGLSVIPLLGVVFFSYYVFSSVLIQNTETLIKQDVDQMETAVSNRLSQAQESARTLLYNMDQRLQNLYTLRSNVEPWYHYEQHRLLTAMIENEQSDNRLANVRVYAKVPDMLYGPSSRFIPFEDLGEELPGWEDFRGKGGPYWITTYPSASGTHVFSVFRTLTSITNANETIAVLVIDLESESLSAILRDNNRVEEADTFIIDGQGKFVANRNPELLGRMWESDRLQDTLSMESGSRVFGQDYVQIRKIQANDWRIVSVAPSQAILRESNSLLGMSLGFSGIVACIAFLVSFLLSKSLTARLKLLLSAMEESKLSRREHILKIIPWKKNGGDEIDRLIRSYNQSTRRIRSLILRVDRVKTMESEAKLKALQSQINSHFLYNALDAINSSIDESNKDAKEIVYGLSNFFRIALSKGLDSIPISKEIEMIREYAKLQTLHYADKIDWLFDVDEQIYPFFITRFTLQPIVENSIHHGIRMKRGKGMITVRGGFEGDYIKIQVSDNGVGMGEDTMKQLQRQLRKGTFQENSGYGLINVNARLKLQHGSDCGIEILKSDEDGTTIEVTITQQI